MKRNLSSLMLPMVLSFFAVTAMGAQSQPAQQPQPGATASQSQPSSPGAQPQTTTPAAPQSSQPATTPSQPQAGTPATPSSSQQTTGNATSGTILPAGTLITIVPTQAIQNAQVGSTYPAKIAQNVVGPNGSVLIPSGTPAQLTVASAVSPTGASEMALALKSVTLNGRTYNISTNQGQASSQSSGTTASQPSNALSPSAGGLLGTLVQVLAGGQQSGNTNQQTGNTSQQGSSAGSGVLSSILGKILTHGSTVNVPSQSQLTFRLDQPLQLQ
ncbi:MAG TPA: hypothetical protein VFP59_13875 [Candidatus Angelobacter sp.]|nr:hypothetical protein [Candidatus Angelobacter sp.]